MNSTSKTPYPRKWRPSLSMIVVAMLVFVLALPIGGMWFFRLYDNLLVRETESELIMQGAFIASIVRQQLAERAFDDAQLEAQIAPRKKRDIRLINPELDLPTTRILPRREPARDATQPPDMVLEAIGKQLYPIIVDAQQTTLAGYRVTDHRGIVIAGRAETSQSLAHVVEVDRALQGNYASVIRERRSASPTPPIYSVSRGTNIRVFVAMPIPYKGKVAGVVYLSRTPSHFLRELYGQMDQILFALFFILAITLALAFVFVRTIKGPIDDLNARTRRIADGDRDALRPLARHGTREIASLSEGLLSMSNKLQDRNEYIRTFANHVSHELKSPLTSIRGAAELLKDADTQMEQEKRERFLTNIMQDTERMSRLLERLRDLAMVEQQPVAGTAIVANQVKRSATAYPALQVSVEGDEAVEVSSSSETLDIIFSNLFENATRHQSTQVIIAIQRTGEFADVVITDNGSGISPANRDKVLEPFFTTRRDTGGTGMGLNIVQSSLVTHGGAIEVLERKSGAGFRITLPLAV